jgi:hypothetical protein
LACETTVSLTQRSERRAFVPERRAFSDEF